MDKHNIFFTRATYNLVRLDWAIIMLIALAAVIVHWREVDWWRFTIAFLLPDLVATFPGLYIYYARRSGEHRSIPGVVHQLYNAGHSLIGVLLICVVWWYLNGALELAMLAFVIHLGGDRSIFGNIYKPLGTAFEPVKHEAFSRFEKEYDAAGNW